MNKIIRINMSELTVSEEEINEDLTLFGGRRLTARILSTEVDPRIHPLSKDNKLVIAPGLFTGTAVPCSGRLSLGSKSPLTGGIKESNVGGTVGQRLSRLGVRAIIIEGKASNGLYLLHFNEEGAKIEPAEELRGSSTYHTVEKSASRYGKEIGVLCIGPAGETLLPTATIASTDGEGHPSRCAGRGGLGAVLGSKRIKAIVVEARDGISIEALGKEPLSEAIRSEIAPFFLRVGKAPHDNTQSYLVKWINSVGGLPTRNFSRGRFQRAEKISGEAITKLISKRGGKVGLPCHRGCIIGCSNIFNDKDGNYVTSSLEYETVVLFGSNLEIDDIDEIAKMDRLCDEIGIDTMDTGGAMGVAMESGRIPFGDSKAVINLLEEIGKGTPEGKLFGSGCAIVGKHFGCKRTPVVKGQSLPSYDPRALKGMGATFATSPMGADHTAGAMLPGVARLDDTKPEGQVEASRGLQIRTAILDSCGLCLNVSASTRMMGYIITAIKALYRIEMNMDGLLAIGREIIRKEVKFNEEAGLGAGTNELPRFFREEALPEIGTVFDIPEEELKSAWKYLFIKILGAR